VGPMMPGDLGRCWAEYLDKRKEMGREGELSG
jgi:hypothetical protein